jgi:hypothetical protein
MFRSQTTAALVGTLILSGLFASCSDTPAPTETKKEAPKKPAIPEGPISALTAYYDTYKIARQIAPDIQTASIVGNEVDGVKSDKGKYAQWTIVFVSATKHEATTFVYTTVEHAGLLRGINNQGSQKWGGPTQTAAPFGNSDFSIDSDAAYTAAASSEKAAAWLAKNADRPVTAFSLGMTSALPAPMWYIMWGDNKKGGFAAYVNAATGKVK